MTGSHPTPEPGSITIMARAVDGDTKKIVTMRSVVSKEMLSMTYLDAETIVDDIVESIANDMRAALFDALGLKP